MCILGVFLFSCVIFSVLSSDKPKCWRFGQYNTTSKVCDCPEGMCSIIPHNFEGGDGKCESKSCNYGTGPSPEDKCFCGRGMTGLNCDLCKTDWGCQQKYNSSNTTSQCINNTIIAEKNMRFQCDVQEEEWVQLMGNYTTIQCFNVGFNTTGSGHCMLQSWAYDSKNHPAGFEAETFWCNGYNCTYHNLPDHKVRYHCTSSYCECNFGPLGSDHCDDPDIQYIVDHMRGFVYVDCPTAKAAKYDCTFKHENFPAFVKMKCRGTECVETILPPPTPIPEPPNYFLYSMLGVSGLCIIILIVVIAVSVVVDVIHAQKTKKEFLHLSSFGACGGKLEFNNLCYYVNVWAEKGCWRAKHQILHNVSHAVHPGQVLAIMGASGAGKTTLLDILANRNKSGMITGNVWFNDKEIDSSFKRMTGYVLQEDALMATLTVKETIRFSADLRLPSCVKAKEKSRIVDDVMKALNIYHIANRKVGDPLSSQRGISGGERKRVSIACEMVINPHVVFLDEPTSGLDATSAFSIVRNLVDCAKNDGRTVIFSIHQPRSNIFELFDDLILLSKGRIVYVGKANKAVEYFEKKGFEFPKYANPADWIIDIVSEEEKAEISRIPVIGHHSLDINEDEVPASEKTPILDDDKSAKPISKILAPIEDHPNMRKVGEDVQADQQAEVLVDGEPRKVYGEKMIQYASGFWGQFYTLSKRAFKNFLRNFYLMPAHFLSAIVMGILLGLIYLHSDINLQGCQNRMGSIFFMLCLLSFTAMSGLEIFIKERPIYVRERANGYYKPFSYYLSKVLFDIIPLRVVPPIFMSGIAYFLIGLRHDEAAHFFNFLGLMILFNIIAGAMCICIGTIAPSVASANIAATMAILGSSLFGGFLLNHDSVPVWLRWCKYLSYWNYSFEAFLINEFVGVRVIIDAKNMPKYVTDGIFFLEELGMNQYNYDADFLVMIGFAVGFLLISGVLLQFLVKEKR